MRAKCVSSVRHAEVISQSLVTDANMDLRVCLKASLAGSIQLEIRNRAFSPGSSFSDLLSAPSLPLSPSLYGPLKLLRTIYIYRSPTSSSLLLPLFLTPSLSVSTHTLL